MKHTQSRRRCFIALIMLLRCVAPAFAQDRTLTPGQLEALSRDGELDGDAGARPAKLPDLTKGDPIGERESTYEWYLGPTGIVSYMVGGLKGDQIEVTSVLAGSPAEGKLRWGDVILGVNGTRFSAGQNMGQLIGKQIIEAERATNKGVIKFIVWRDHNFLARNKKKDIAGVDVEELFNEVDEDNSLYDWKDEKAQAEEVRSANYEEFPIKGEILEVTLTLEVLPEYSDTSPYDCLKAERIREDAWKVLEEQVKAGKVVANRFGSIVAVALAASGKPEHRELLREWVRSPKAKSWHPSFEGSIDMRKPQGYMSWRMGFEGLDAALYYDATGDDFVLPAVREYAIKTAMGQAGGGSWGHTFAWPVFNGGELHGMNPGYGALNAAGNRCFMLVCLAKKLGVEHPEIDLAIERGTRFFRSYYEKGAVPYGHHGAAYSDDSNGKNTGVAFGLKMIGDKEGAKWFAQMSAHASFTRRGGHGDSYFWHYSPWAATMTGPRATIATHRNLRWWFTLCRLHDGRFVLHPLGDGNPRLRNPTATYALHYSAPLKQTLLTGKDADEDLFFTDKEYEQFLTIAQGQFNDDRLIEQAGPQVTERSTDEIFTFLDVFNPKARDIYAKELGKRYKAGENEIALRLARLLKSDNPRLCGAAARALRYCGPDESLEQLAGLSKLLKHEEQFVRIQSAKALHSASDSMDTQLALIQAAVDNDEMQAMAPNSLGAFMQSAVFTGQSTLASTPFEAGHDGRLVEDALAKLIVLDPAGSRPMLRSRSKVWDKDTVLRLAGPLIYASEKEQIADQMFSNRRPSTIALLERHGYQEAVDAGVSYLRKYQDIPRHIRPKVFYKHGNVDAKLLMRHPEAAKKHVDDLYRWMLDKPLALAFEGKDEPSIHLYELINALEAVEQEKALTSLADEVSAAFAQRLGQADTPDEKVKLCLAELDDPEQRNYFRKIAAMRALVKIMGPEDALVHVLPYLSHEHWRVEQAARGLTLELLKAHEVTRLYKPFERADDGQAIGILAVLAEAQDKGGRKLAEQALTHPSPEVRAQAVQTLYVIADGDVLNQVFDVMRSTPDKAVLLGCEKALQPGLGDADFAGRVRAKAIAMLPDAEPALRETLYWLIAQCGGSQSMSVLAQAAQTEDDRQFAEVINVLSYCPDPGADVVLLGIIKANKGTKRADSAASHGIRRMLIGQAGIGTRPIESQLDWAEDVLDLTLNDDTIAYLGRIRTGRCAFILQRAMRRGAPTSAAKAIIAATSNLSDATDKDRKLAESALVDAIEFIEVTYLRGGASDQLDKNQEAWRTYAQWKSVSIAAGKNLLKLTAQKKPDPLPEFDDLELDF